MNGIHLENGKLLKIQPVRQRKIYSCVACHTKKIKCSKHHPVCDRCEKLHLKCEYYANERVSRRPGKLKLKSEIKYGNHNSDQGHESHETAKPSNDITRSESSSEPIEKENSAEFSAENPADSSYSPNESTSEYTFSEWVINNLPTKEFADQCMVIYKQQIDFKYPLLNFKEFEEKYTKFHQDQTSIDEVDFYISYYIILLTGCLLLGQTNSFLKFKSVVRKIFKYLHFPESSENYSLRYLQLFTLFQSMLPFPESEAVQYIVAIARLFELHHDPIAYHKLSDPDLVQFRRLLWWQIVRLEWRTSVLSAKIPEIDIRTADTGLPLAIDANRTLSIQVEIINCKFRFVQLMNEMIHSNPVPSTVKAHVIDIFIRCSGSIMSLQSDLNSNRSELSKKMVSKVVEDLKLLPDKGAFILYGMLITKSYLYDIDIPDYSHDTIYYNYSDFTVYKDFNIILTHLFHLLMRIMDNLASEPAPFRSLMLSTCYEPHLSVNVLGLFLWNLVKDMKTFIASEKFNSTCDSLVAWLKKDSKLNGLNKMLAGDRFFDFSVPGIQRVGFIINGLFLIVKCYPLKYKGSKIYKTVYDFIDANELNKANNKFLKFVEPYEQDHIGNLELDDISNGATENSNNENVSDNGDVDIVETVSCSVISPKASTALAASKGYGFDFDEVGLDSVVEASENSIYMLDKDKVIDRNDPATFEPFKIGDFNFNVGRKGVNQKIKSAVYELVEKDKSSEVQGGDCEFMRRLESQLMELLKGV